MAVKSESGHPRARQFLEDLLARGRHSFAAAELQGALGVSPAAAKAALARLARQKAIASPAKGFYVIVPPEYRSLGCLPADQFIPDLLKWLELPYYAALLTAAQYHGAAHHRPQVFQVFLEGRRRPLNCGRVRVSFIIRKHLRNVPVQSFNTPQGTLIVSTPEATALDLVGYQQRAGGLGNVATVLSELAERLDPGKLVEAAHAAPMPWSQRLGYMLEQVGAERTAVPLKEYVRAQAHEATVLLPRTAYKKSSRHADWKLYVNADVESEA